MTDQQETLGARLRRLREEQGLTQGDLAMPGPLDEHHSRGITISYISRLESDDRYPSLLVIRILAAKLGVTPEHLEHGDVGPVLTFEIRADAIDAAAARWGGDDVPVWHSLTTDERKMVTLGIHDQILDTLAARIYAVSVLESERSVLA